MSLPARERGSKPCERRRLACKPQCRSPRGSVDRNYSQEKEAKTETVAPRAGAWIETRRSDGAQGHRLVAPRAGAWIETSTACTTCAWPKVAPRAGAWIETPSARSSRARSCVAPRAGAWIETSRRAHQRCARQGRSPRGSVDRNIPLRALTVPVAQSLPARERGSKRVRIACQIPRHGSLPARERGSKRRAAVAGVAHQLSLPARERGSKPEREEADLQRQRRSPRGSVDRNIACRTCSA